MKRMMYNFNQISIKRNNAVSGLQLTTDSGRIIYRNKVDTIIGIKHPGIVLGVDSWGTTWVIHNHYKIGHPQIVTWDEFSIGEEIFYDTRPVVYDPLTIVDNAAKHWFSKKQYSWLFNNCQHFVNEVTRNQRHSETIDRVSNNALFFGALLAFLGFVLRIPALKNFGIILMAGGGAGKILSRI